MSAIPSPRPEPSPAEADPEAARARAARATERAAELSARYAGISGIELVRAMIEVEFPGRIAVSSSFGTEAAVMLDLVAQIDPATPVIFLDTRKLFGETLRYRGELRNLLGLTDLRAVGPSEAEEAAQDPDGVLWRADPDACCRFRKVVPLARALAGFDAWFTGRKRFHGGQPDGPAHHRSGRPARQDQPPCHVGPRGYSRSLRRAGPARAPAGGGRLQLGGLHALHRPAAPRSGPARRPMGRPGQDRMRHPYGAARLARERKPAVSTAMSSATLDRLDALESQSVYILREAFHGCEKTAMLWSIGKDSNVLMWLARKAFFGHVPFPVVHIDTSYKLPEMIAFRDRMAKEWGIELIVGQNRAALDAGMNHTKGRVVCCGALKTQPLRETVAAHGFTGIILGIRRDEEGTRAKERVFSPRGEDANWDFKNQPPEFWDQYKTDFPAGTHVRIHPLLHWTEIDVWRYIRRENIPVVDLYFAREGRRYRSLGCAPCTGTVASEAATVDEIIAELESTRISERSGRAQDQESEDAFERLRTSGYM